MGNDMIQPRGRFALTNGHIILPDRVVSGQALVIEGDKILGLTPTSELPSDTEQIDVGRRWIAPGLIDILVHGGMGYTFAEATEEAFASITRENVRHGVTSLLAATVTVPIPRLVEILNFGRQWMHKPSQGSRVLGMYLEGPYVNPVQAGALDPNCIRTPGDGALPALLEHRDVLKVMVVAPELPGAMELIDSLLAAGVMPAAGHSSGKDELVREAMQHGLSHIHHIWSGQSMMVRVGPWRKPGLLEASLVFDGLTAEMISNNKHLPSTLMRLAYKCIGPDRLSAVSDATPGAGLPEGTRFKMGGLEYDVHDGIGMMLDRSAFAGSTTLLNQMIPVLTDVVGVPLPEAVRMASLTPARTLGWDRRKGSLEAGKDADVAVFEDDFTAWHTMMDGRWVYCRQEPEE
jgi:N-acetylglucosamine-6-phosphate deacetylase